MKKVFSFNSELYKVTGVQKVLMDVHHAVQGEYDAKIVGTVPFEKVDANLNIQKDEYIQWRKNPFAFYNSIVFVHERKYLAFFWLLNHILFQKIEVIYIHHNIFHNQKLLSIMPKKVVSISDRSTKNLIDFFKVPLENIYKIHNCVADIKPRSHKECSKETITILYPARINGVKRQLDIYRNLKGKLDKRIKILFAGDGPYLSELKELTNNDPQFECLGFRSDVTSLLQDCDYMMLFSKVEGLSITLIEATMCGTPIVTNDVGGNLEIAHAGENAFIASDWDCLVDVLNRLPKVSAEDYSKMSTASRNIYETNFTFETFKSKYLKLLK